MGEVYGDGETCSPEGEFGRVFKPTAEVIVGHLFEIGYLVDVRVTGLSVVEGGSWYHLLVDVDTAAGGGTEAAEEVRRDKFAAFWERGVSVCHTCVDRKSVMHHILSRASCLCFGYSTVSPQSEALCTSEKSVVEDLGLLFA